MYFLNSVMHMGCIYDYIFFFVEVLGVLFSSVFLILSCKNAGDKLLVGRNLHILH